MQRGFAFPVRVIKAIRRRPQVTALLLLFTALKKAGLRKNGMA
jgi:hypothetical protein